MLFWNVAHRFFISVLVENLNCDWSSFLASARAPDLISGVSGLGVSCPLFYPLSHGASTLAFLSSSGPQHKPGRSPNRVAEF